MTREALEPCLAEFDPAIHHGKKIVEGVDLSQNRDLTVKASIVETGSMDVEVVVEGKPEIVSKPNYDCWIEAWTPGAPVTERGLSDKAPCAFRSEECLGGKEWVGMCNTWWVA